MFPKWQTQLGQFEKEAEDVFFMEYDGFTCKLYKYFAQKYHKVLMDKEQEKNDNKIDMSIDSSLLFSVVKSPQNSVFVKQKIGESQMNQQVNTKEMTARQRSYWQKQNLLLKSSNIFKAICLPEKNVVKRILCKFQFVNEDILRSQVMNQMKSFTSRDKNSDIKPFYQFPSAGGNLLNQSSMRLLPGVSGSPLKMY